MDSVDVETVPCNIINMDFFDRQEFVRFEDVFYTFLMNL